ncbi:TPA: hypothetical protein ENG04_00665, partial [Candidatus Poribacteria bacterium]|nr:hypothetical protein [Candidatus Poribacteria bacterium]HEX28577.1 hypothetical protein [Candidatus Poribacteria bacterium]
MLSAAIDSVKIHIKGNSVTRQLAALLHLIRPHQWVKNGFLLGPLLFSGSLANPSAVIRTMEAFLCFCLLSSGV